MARDLLREAAHHKPRSADEWRAFFDQAPPRAASALYAQTEAQWRATAAEVVTFLTTHFTFTRVLDWGCGAGRIAVPLAQYAHVTAADISLNMLKSWAGAARVQIAGNSLNAFADEAFDLILAADSFPYMANAGIAESQMQNAARVLAPRGHLVIANFSYDGSAPPPILSLKPVLHCRPFRLWDAEVFAFRKDAP